MAENNENLSKGISLKIDYRIIALLCVAAIVYEIYAYLYSDYTINHFTILDIPWILNPLGIGIAGLVVAKRYWNYHDVLGKTYLALGIGFLLYFVGSSSYEYCSDFQYSIAYQSDHPDACFPALPDVFFLLFYPFLFYHLIRNIKQWGGKIELRTIIGLGVLACAVAILFSYITVIQTDKFDEMFYVSETYVILDASQLSLVILGGMVFRKTKLGNVWLLLVSGFLIYAISDFWYYYSAAYGQYDESHPVNALFQLGFMITIYALYKHKKVV